MDNILSSFPPTAPRGRHEVHRQFPDLLFTCVHVQLRDGWWTPRPSDKDTDSGNDGDAEERIWIEVWKSHHSWILFLA